MLARNIMTTNPVTVTSETPVGEITRILLERRVSAVPVVDSEGRFLGTVSILHLICRKANPAHYLPQISLRDPLAVLKDMTRELHRVTALTAEEIMDREGPTLKEDDTVVHIAGVMMDTGATYLPVVEEGRLLGVVTRFDVLKTLVEAREKQGSGS